MDKMDFTDLLSTLAVVKLDSNFYDPVLIANTSNQIIQQEQEKVCSKKNISKDEIIGLIYIDFYACFWSQQYI